jgi:hypothetical protein
MDGEQAPATTARPAAQALNDRDIVHRTHLTRCLETYPTRNHRVMRRQGRCSWGTFTRHLTASSQQNVVKRA